MRIAFTTTPPIPEAAVDADCAAATASAAALLEGLGHDVEEVTPPWQSDDLADLFGAYFGAHVAVGVYFASLAAGRAEPAPSDVEALSWALWQRSLALSAVHFQVLQTQLQARMRALVAFLEGYDALLTPALAERPLPIGTLDANSSQPLETFTRSGYFTPFTPIFNASGQPAIALPLFQGDDGLPLAVQIAGRPAGEGALLALAGQLEQALPWAARRADVDAFSRPPQAAPPSTAA
jgi:amidase